MSDLLETEPHYSATQVAQMWAISEDTVRGQCDGEPGVLAPRCRAFSRIGGASHASYVAFRRRFWRGFTRSGRPGLDQKSSRDVAEAKRA